MEDFCSQKAQHHTTEIVDRHYSKHQNSTAYDLLCIYSHNSSDDHNNSYNRHQRHNIGYLIHMLSRKAPEKNSQENRDQNYLYHRNHHSPEGYFHPGSCQNIYKKRCHQRRCQCGNYGHSHRKRHITSCDIGDHIAGCSARTASHQDHSQCQICRKVHHFTQKPGDHRHNGILSHCTDHHFFGSGKNCPEVIQFYGQTHTKHDHSQKYRRIVRHPGKAVTPEKSQAGKSDDNDPDISGCKAADNSDFL